MVTLTLAVVVVVTLWAGLSEFRWAVPGDAVLAALIPGIIIACGLSGVMARALIDLLFYGPSQAGGPDTWRRSGRRTWRRR